MQDTASYTVLIIDDHPMLRKGLVQLLAMEPALHTVGDVGSGAEGVALALQLQPDLVLVDLNMKGMSGIDTLKALREADLDCHIIIFTVSDDDADVIEALRCGADGYLLKDMEPEALLDKLLRAAAGEMVITEALAGAMANALRGDDKRRISLLQQLTDREKQILKLITRGLSNKLIARKLDISEGTVKVHVKHVLKKLKLNSRVEAAVWGVKQGI